MQERKNLTTKKEIEQMRKELEEKKNSKQTVFSVRVVKVVAYVILVMGLIFLLGNNLRLKNKGEIPSLFGYYIFSVESQSMEPTLQVGDLFVAKKVKDTQQLAPGTIITFKNQDGQIVTHRIVECVMEDDDVVGYRTKGDNVLNSIDEEVVGVDQIVARYQRTIFSKKMRK